MKLFELFSPGWKKLFFNRNFFILLGIDVILLCVSWFGSYLIRFDFDIPEKFVDEMFTIRPAAILIKLVCFYLFGVYRGMWRGPSNRVNCRATVRASASPSRRGPG